MKYQHRESQADKLKGIAYDAFVALVQGHEHMDLIHNPRNYTRQQNILMEVVVGYVWDMRQVLIREGASELTENIKILLRLAPKDIALIPRGSCEALQNYTAQKVGIKENVSRQAKAYELLATWIDAVHDYAVHTRQLE